MNGSQAAQSDHRETARKTLRHLGTRLLLALAAGCALYSAAYLLTNFSFMRLLVEQAGDARIQLVADYKAPVPGTTPILFLDLDQESYALLGRPAVTPRGVLATLLEKVAEGKPKLIILDFDPTWPGDKEGTQKLADTLARLGHGPTPILLYRTPMAPAEKGGASYFRPSPELDPVVEGSHSLMWVSSGAVASADGVVRRAPLWINGCLGEKPVRYANSALAGWMFLQDTQRATVKERLTTALVEADGSCKTAATQRKVALTVGSQDYRVGNDWPTGTITYSMSAELAKGQRRDSKALMKLSAVPFIKVPRDVSTEIFGDYAVIIGASARDLRDIHFTPLGEMPGALVIANQLRSLQETGPDKMCAFQFGLLTTAILCVVTFLSWLGFRYIAPVAPYIVEQVYSMLIGGTIWVGLIALDAQALLYPLVQYLVILVLFALEHGKSSSHSKIRSVNTR